MSQRQLKTDYKKSVETIAGKYERRAGFIGLNETTIQTGSPGLIWVRLSNGQGVKAINKLAPNVYNYPVVISRSSASVNWEVVELRQPYTVQIEGVGAHHAQHEYPSSDTVWIRDAQFMPMLVLPYSGNTVYLYGGVVQSGGAYFVVNNQSIDLSGYQPAYGGLWALIEIINGAVTVTVSSVNDSKDALSPGDIPRATGIALCAVLLYGQTTIQRNTLVNDFVDLRFTVGNTSPDGVGDVGSHFLLMGA